MKERTSLILGEVGSVKILNEKKQEVFITPEHLKIGKLKLSEILAKQQECNNFVDIKLKQAERDFLEYKEKINKEISDLQNEVLELKRVLAELVNFAVEA
jgi:hypothetical protein